MPQDTPTMTDQQKEAAAFLVILLNATKTTIQTVPPLKLFQDLNDDLTNWIAKLKGSGGGTGPC